MSIAINKFSHNIQYTILLKMHIEVSVRVNARSLIFRKISSLAFLIMSVIIREKPTFRDLHISGKSFQLPRV